MGYKYKNKCFFDVYQEYYPPSLRQPQKFGPCSDLDLHFQIQIEKTFITKIKLNHLKISAENSTLNSSLNSTLIYKFTCLKLIILKLEKCPCIQSIVFIMYLYKICDITITTFLVTFLFFFPDVYWQYFKQNQNSAFS